MLLNPSPFILGTLLLSNEISALQSSKEIRRSPPSNLTLPLGWQDSMSLQNHTASPSNSSLNEPLILCDGDKYRRNLNAGSCLNALNQIPEDAAKLRFSNRALSRHYDVSLPSRWISQDGLCIVEPVLKDTVELAFGSYENIREAGFALMAHCVFPNFEGGIATDIGPSKDLGLIITSYDPRVQCNKPPAPPAESCKRIVDAMPVSPLQKWFGRGGDKLGRPDILLPKYLRETSDRCYFSIQTSGPTDRSSWFEMWEAVQALYGMCGRFGRTGTALSRGMNGYLYINMGNQRPKVASVARQKRASTMRY